MSVSHTPLLFLLATVPAAIALPARAADDPMLHPTWYSVEVWAGVHDGQFATVSSAGQALEPRLNLWLLDDRWWDTYDTDRYVCIVSMTASSDAGGSAPDAWIDWAVQLDPIDAFSPACASLDPDWAADWLPTVPDWITEVTIGALDPSMAEAYAGMWGDSWTPIADVAFGGDMYAMGRSVADDYMGGVEPFVGVAWQVDADLALVDEGLPLNYLDELALPFLPLVDGSSFVSLADVGDCADGYYWLTTAWLFTPLPCEDTDADAVCDLDDTCGDTPAGAVVDAAGCSVADYCPCDGGWRNHGAYVACVAHTSGDFVAAGLFNGREKGMVQSHAASSSCGR